MLYVPDWALELGWGRVGGSTEVSLYVLCHVVFLYRHLPSCGDVISFSCFNVVYFRVRDYFLWCINMVPTWNLVWGSRLCFLPNLLFLPHFYLTSIPLAERPLTSRLWSSQPGCSLQLYKRSWSPQSDH